MSFVWPGMLALLVVVPAPTSGVLLSIAAEEDETVPVGAPLGVIGDAGEAPESGAAPATEAPAAKPLPRRPRQLLPLLLPHLPRLLQHLRRPSRSRGEGGCSRRKRAPGSQSARLRKHGRARHRDSDRPARAG